MQHQELKPEEGLDIRRAAHPVICILHVGFKLMTVFCYLFMRIITNSSIHTFITVIILASVDFWFVKNVAGRYLVGLRWWNGDDDSGDEGWKWEHDSFKIQRSDVDRNIFWYSLIGSAVFWLVMVIIKFLAFSLFWGMLVIICFSLAFTNLYAYYQCNNDYKNYVDKAIYTWQKIERASRNFIQTATGNINNA